jgi:toxin-antitoxin system PIN domain toxin
VPPAGGPALTSPLVDANLLLYAHHGQFPSHGMARRWWGDTLSHVALVGIPWPTILAFVRISTHPRALERPLAMGTAWATVEEWLDRPNVWIPGPTDRHRSTLARMLLNTNATGNHTTDAHLAALAVEWGLQLQSADRDFARYPGLNWHNPLAPP